MIPRSAANHAEHTLTPDMPVTTPRWDHLERAKPVSSISYRRKRLQFNNFRDFEYLSANGMRPGYIQ